MVRDRIGLAGAHGGESGLGPEPATVRRAHERAAAGRGHAELARAGDGEPLLDGGAQSRAVADQAGVVIDRQVGTCTPSMTSLST